MLLKIYLRTRAPNLDHDKYEIAWGIGAVHGLHGLWDNDLVMSEGLGDDRPELPWTPNVEHIQNIVAQNNQGIAVFPTFQLFFFFFFVCMYYRIVCVTTMLVNWWLSGLVLIEKKLSQLQGGFSQGTAPVTPRLGCSAPKPPITRYFPTFLQQS